MENSYKKYLIFLLTKMPINGHNAHAWYYRMVSISCMSIIPQFIWCHFHSGFWRKPSITWATNNNILQGILGARGGCFCVGSCLASGARYFRNGPTLGCYFTQNTCPKFFCKFLVFKFCFGEHMEVRGRVKILPARRKTREEKNNFNSEFNLQIK